MMDCCDKKVPARKKERSEEEVRALRSRINRIIGQLNGVGNMIENGVYCDDVLIQLSAIDKAIKSLANRVLDGHMHTCLVENIQRGNLSVVDELVDLFRRFQ